MLGLAKKNRLRICPQLDTYDCGPACLEMIVAYYGRTYPTEYLRQLCRQDRQGSSLAAIARAAEHLGFRTLAVKVSFKELWEKAPRPCIAFLTAGHYVVVEKVWRNRVRVADPNIGFVTYSKEEFEQCWLSETGLNWGVLLLLEPTGRIIEHPETRTASAAAFLNPLWRDVKRHLVLLGAAALVSLLAQLILPFLSAAVVDVSIAHHNINILLVIGIAQCVLLVSRLGVEAVQGWTLAYIGARCDIALIAQFLVKLTRLPLAFFDGKTAGDLVQRISDQKAIEQFLTNSLSQLFVALLSLLVFGTVLALFRPLLFLIFVAGSVVYAAYCFLYFRHQRILNYKNFRLSARKQGIILEFLAGMQEIKLNNAEQQRRWEWEKTQHQLSRVQIKAQVLAIFQRIGGSLLNQFTNLALVLLSSLEVIHGRMSLGTMVAVQYVIGQLNLPLQQLIGLMIQTQDASLSYTRTQQIHAMNDEEAPALNLVPDRRVDINFKSVSFGYGGTSPRLVFRDIDLHLPAGKTTAIVGRSGSGKTTLLKLILKFYPVNQGEILLGAVNINDVSHSQWRRMCGIVMQDGYIFSDTILRNIAVGDDTVDVERVEEVARIAQIHDYIESLTLSYSTRIGRDGIGISRGQAQRILIARALYKDPDYLLFDEATSALDAQTESVIVHELRNVLKGKTAVIIAHRMSTVRNADQIVVLEGGAVAEIGTHEDLVARRGIYFSIIENQLELGR